MTELRSEWCRLGVGFAVEAAQGPVDPEELILRSASEGPRDARLFWGAASWLKRYGDLVDGRRLRRKLGKDAGSAVLAALVLASESIELKGLLERCQPLRKPRPLFEVMESTSVLREKVEKGALPEFRRWGLLVDEVSLNLDMLRPASWVLRQNRNLLVRALLGANLRADLLDTLLSAKAPLTASDLHRLHGRQYASVHASLSALALTNWVARRQDGNRLFYSVPQDIQDWLEHFPGAEPPAKRRLTRAA
ncbi:MAG: hypothetical protein HY303_02840 [Candidatus Wallbacteria bacterium]|nr:hypothetical protein [Candidatus Wallbacteria bacterium]